MPRIFISYRRSDSSEVVSRIYDRLLPRFGKQQVFRDLDSIPLSVSFREYITDFISNTDIVLVVIGPSWINAQSSNGGRRIDETEDLVRIEIETALVHGKKLIPLTVKGAKIPSEAELPPTLRSIAQINGKSIGEDPHFHRDMDALIAGITESEPGSPQTIEGQCRISDVQVEQDVDQKFALVDFRVANTSPYDVLVNQMKFEVVQFQEHYAFEYLEYSAKYDFLDIGALAGIGDTIECEISQFIRRGGVDRFGIKLAALSLEKGIYRMWILKPILATNLGELFGKNIEVWLPKPLRLTI
jgi:TIR domain